MSTIRWWSNTAIRIALVTGLIAFAACPGVAASDPSLASTIVGGVCLGLGTIALLGSILWLAGGLEISISAAAGGGGRAISPRRFLRDRASLLFLLSCVVSIASEPLQSRSPELVKWFTLAMLAAFDIALVVIFVLTPATFLLRGAQLVRWLSSAVSVAIHLFEYSNAQRLKYAVGDLDLPSRRAIWAHMLFAKLITLFPTSYAKYFADDELLRAFNDGYGDNAGQLTWLLAEIAHTVSALIRSRFSQRDSE